MIKDSELTRSYIGSYRISRVLGQGNYGLVYHAYQPFLDRQVAVKVINTDLSLDDYTETQFMQEARTVAKLRHPNIVTVYEFGTAENENKTQAFMVMEYLPGATLQQVMKTESLGLEQTVGITEQLADALDYAHAHHIIHRDLKPSNVIFSDRHQPVIVDFGLAKLVEISSSHGRTAENIMDTIARGTPAYMSPEQALGRYPTPASDQYSLALIVYEMLARQRPFQGTTLQDVISAKITEAPTPLSETAPQYPEAASLVLARALTQDPVARYPTASAFARALSEALLPDRKVTRVVTVSDPFQAAQLRRARQTILGFMWGLILLTVVAALFCASLFIRGYRNGDGAFIWDGIVASSSVHNGYHDVIALWPGGPAQRAGVEVGDRIQTDIYYDTDVRNGDFTINGQPRSSYPGNWQPHEGDLIERTVIRNGNPVNLAYFLELTPFNLIIFFVQIPASILAFFCATWLLRRWGAEPGVTIVTMLLMAGSFALVASGVTNVIRNIDSLAVMVFLPLLLHLTLIYPEPLQYLEAHPRRIWAIYIPFPIGVFQFLLGAPLFDQVNIVIYGVYMLLIAVTLILKWGRHDLKHYPALWWLLVVWIIASGTVLLGEAIAAFDGYATVQALWGGNGLTLLAVDYGIIAIGSTLSVLLGTVGLHRVQLLLGKSLPSDVPLATPASGAPEKTVILNNLS